MAVRTDINAADLNAEQKQIAQMIINQGIEYGASQRDIKIALITANRESDFKNLSTPSPDGFGSYGVYQGRATDHGQGDFGYGTREQIVGDIPGQIKKFYLGTAPENNAGLLANPNRDSMDAAHASRFTQGFAKQYMSYYQEDSQAGRAANSMLLGEVPGIDPSAVRSQPATGGALYSRKTIGTQLRPAGGAAPVSTPDPTPPAVAGSGNASAAPAAQSNAWAEQFQKALDDFNAREGTMYEFGGKGIGGPRAGIDCSGLVQQMYAAMGIPLGRIGEVNAAGLAEWGPHISFEDAKAGDLLAFDRGTRNGSGAEHIAIYDGDGGMYEAPRTGLPVRHRKLTDADRKDSWAVDMSKKVPNRAIPGAPAPEVIAEATPRPTAADARGDAGDPIAPGFVPNAEDKGLYNRAKGIYDEQKAGEPGQPGTGGIRPSGDAFVPPMAEHHFAENFPTLVGAKTAWDKANGLTGGLAGKVIDAATTPEQLLARGAMGAMDAIGLDTVAQGFGRGAQMLGGKIGDVADAIGLDSAAGGLGKGVAGLGKGAQVVGSGIKNGIAGLFNNGGEAMGGRPLQQSLLPNPGPLLGDIANGAGHALAAGVNAGQAIGGGVGNVGQAIGGGVGNAFGMGTHRLGSVMQNLGGVAGTVGNNVADVAGGVGHSVADAVGGVGHAIGGLFGGGHSSAPASVVLPPPAARVSDAAYSAAAANAGNSPVSFVPGPAPNERSYFSDAANSNRVEQAGAAVLAQQQAAQQAAAQAAAERALRAQQAAQLQALQLADAQAAAARAASFQTFQPIGITMIDPYTGNRVSAVDMTNLNIARAQAASASTAQFNAAYNAVPVTPVSSTSSAQSQGALRTSNNSTYAPALYDPHAQAVAANPAFYAPPPTPAVSYNSNPSSASYTLAALQQPVQYQYGSSVNSVGGVAGPTIMNAPRISDAAYSAGAYGGTGNPNSPVAFGARISDAAYTAAVEAQQLALRGY